MVDLSEFEKKTNIIFKDKKLLEQAFIHRSYINESNRPAGSSGQVGSRLAHNERLEFLGDAVLELVITDYLYNKYPDRDEGDLTAYRSALVNAVTIGEVALTIGMNDYLLLSKGEAKDIGRARSYILANTYEAYVGAVYLDQGYNTARDFIASTLFHKIDVIVAKKLWRDPKSLIQEKAQEHLNITPSYKVISETGPDHDKHFTIGVFFGNDRIAEGKGKSKQEGEQAAARAALENNGWLD